MFSLKFLIYISFIFYATIASSQSIEVPRILFKSISFDSLIVADIKNNEERLVFEGERRSTLTNEGDYIHLDFGGYGSFSFPISNAEYISYKSFKYISFSDGRSKLVIADKDGEYYFLVVSYKTPDPTYFFLRKFDSDVYFSNYEIGEIRGYDFLKTEISKNDVSIFSDYLSSSYKIKENEYGDFSFDFFVKGYINARALKPFLIASESNGIKSLYFANGLDTLIFRVLNREVAILTQKKGDSKYTYFFLNVDRTYTEDLNQKRSDFNKLILKYHPVETAQPYDIKKVAQKYNLNSDTLQNLNAGYRRYYNSNSLLIPVSILTTFNKNDKTLFRRRLTFQDILDELE